MSILMGKQWNVENSQRGEFITSQNANGEQFSWVQCHILEPYVHVSESECMEFESSPTESCTICYMTQQGNLDTISQQLKQERMRKKMMTTQRVLVTTAWQMEDMARCIFYGFLMTAPPESLLISRLKPVGQQKRWRGQWTETECPGSGRSTLRSSWDAREVVKYPMKFITGWRGMGGWGLHHTTCSAFHLFDGDCLR